MKKFITKHKEKLVTALVIIATLSMLSVVVCDYLGLVNAAKISILTMFFSVAFLVCL